MTPSALAPVSRPMPPPASRREPPWITADVSARQITDEVMRPLVSRPGAAWLASFAVALLALAVGVASVAYEVSTGIGVCDQPHSQPDH